MSRHFEDPLDDVLDDFRLAAEHMRADGKGHLLEGLRKLVDHVRMLEPTPAQSAVETIDVSTLDEADEQVEIARKLLEKVPPSDADLIQASEALRICITDLLMWAGRVNEYLEANGVQIRGR